MYARGRTDTPGASAEIPRGGTDAAAALSKILSLKDKAHYGLVDVSTQNVKTALRKAREILDFARQIVGR